MPKAKTSGTMIDSPFTGVRGKPSLTEAPGLYNEHASVGPKGESGGFPLKFYDTAIKTPKGSLPAPSMTPTPADIVKS